MKEEPEEETQICEEKQTASVPELNNPKEVDEVIVLYYIIFSMNNNCCFRCSNLCSLHKLLFHAFQLSASRYSFSLGWGFRIICVLRFG